jgi:hypothetical protein
MAWFFVKHALRSCRVAETCCGGRDYKGDEYGEESLAHLAHLPEANSPP